MVLPLMNMPLMVPVTIMPLAGSGATAPKGDSNSWGRPRPWPVPNTFSLRCAKCALSSVAMGLSGKMVGIGILALAKRCLRKELAFRSPFAEQVKSSQVKSSQVKYKSESI